jgi:hypothetical protein
MMSEVNKISELIQKFGLISGKKQVFKTIQSFLSGFTKADIAVCVTSSPDGRYLFNITSGVRLSEDIFIRLSESIEPFIVKYFVGESDRPRGGFNVSNLIDFEHYGQPEEMAARESGRKKNELKGSLVLPVFLESKIYSIFAIFSADEFELSRQELLSINILAHMSALSLKTLSLNQKMQKLISDLKLEKSGLIEKAGRLSKVLELSHSLISLNSYEKLLSVTLKAYCHVFGVDQAAILGINHHKKELFVEDCAGFSDGFASSYRLPSGYGLIGAVVEKNEPYFRKNIFESGEELAVIPFSGVSGLVCGAVVLYDKFNRLSFGDDEYELMWMLANFFSLALNIIKVHSVNETYDQQIETGGPAVPAAGGLNETSLSKASSGSISAAGDAGLNAAGGICESCRERAADDNHDYFQEYKQSIHKILTPSRVVETPGIQIAYNYLQAADCGGDLIDIFTTPNNYINIALADVSGRGIQAGVTSAMFRAQLKTVCSFGGELRKIFFDLNNLICEDIDIYNFITLFLLQISPAGGRAAFSNAGYCPVIHYIKEGDGAVVHESRNTPLGVMKSTDFKEGILILNKGDILLLYSNGLVELKNPAGEVFGRNRLCGLVKSLASMECGALKDAITAEALRHCGKEENYDDDIAFVVVKVG